MPSAGVVPLALTAALLVGERPAAHAADDEAPTLLGFATDDWRADLPVLEAETGKFPAFRQVFWTVDLDWSLPWLPGFLDDHHAWGIVPWQVTHVNDLDGFNGGASDADLDAMVDFYVDWMGADSSKRLVVAPFPEPNLTGHPWSGDPEGYKLAFERIHDAFRAAGLGPDQVRFAFVMNGISSAGFSYDQFYPGDELVDILSFNKHNRNLVLSSDDPWRDYEDTFGMHIDEMTQLVSLTKPIFINQTGSVDDDQGRRSQWLTDMFVGLKDHPQVIGAVYFNRNKEENGIVSDFRVLIGSSVDAAFVAGYQTWSDPSAVSWVFDGGMDAWVAAREAEFGTGFTDVPAHHTFAEAIRWLADSGITLGCNPPANNLYCPDATLTRGQMAAMLNPRSGLPAASIDHFSDDGASVFSDDINRLAEAGITRGCNPPLNTQFCPDQKVSRGQMAAFLVRALGYDSTGDGDFFVDDDDSIFETDIDRLRVAGVTYGCNPPDNTRFCPDGMVTRGQMAAFLYRALAGA